MSDRPSHTEAEMESEDGGEQYHSDLQMEPEDGGEQNHSDLQSFSAVSSSLRAVIRIRQKYRALKKRRQELSAAAAGEPGAAGGGGGLVPGAPTRTSPKIFTFDLASSSSYAAPSSVPQRKKRKRRRGVMFPTGGRRRAPPTPPPSRAKYCLYLLCAILCLQVYNAIENLDDHVLRYDLDGLEKTLRREVFGQQGAMEALLGHLRDYLSTYVHNRPLVLSVHGPAGVGKSHVGRLLAGHFRSVVGEALVLQYYVLHHCPLEADARGCARALAAIVSETVARAEEEEKIPLFVFDEAEHVHADILDALLELVGGGTSSSSSSARSTPNEYLNAVYLFLGGPGHAHITRHLLRNSSSVAAAGGGAAGRHGALLRELTPALRQTLAAAHPLWAEAELVALGLLEKSHVTECFLDEMTREGFYPDRAHGERLAGEVEYYPATGGRQYARRGCKAVVAAVNLL